MKKIVNRVLILSLIGVFALFQSCKVSYSFSGATVDQRIKTFSVQYFDNRAPLVQPQLAEMLTSALKDKILAQTNLELVNGTGDVDFSGDILNYETRPTAITGQETAAMNRLTITVKVKFTNSIVPETDFDSNFSRYEDYSSSEDLSAVQDELMQQITEYLVEDIFNKAFVNW